MGREQPSKALRRWRFGRPTLTPGQEARLKMMEGFFADLDGLIAANVRFSREQGHAISKLQEALFWVQKAIEIEGCEGMRTNDSEPATRAPATTE